jgi:hypothetical protein
MSVVKERAMLTIARTSLNLRIEEKYGFLYVNNRAFETKEELDKYITKLELLTIFTRLAEEFDLDYGYDGKVLTIQFG